MKFARAKVILAVALLCCVNAIEYQNSLSIEEVNTTISNPNKSAEQAVIGIASP